MGKNRAASSRQLASTNESYAQNFVSEQLPTRIERHLPSASTKWPAPNEQFAHA